MLEAHEEGVATVIVCPLELAELYRPLRIPTSTIDRVAAGHNGDVNEMGYVVRALQKSVPTLSREEAEVIMLEGTRRAWTHRVVCPLELADADIRG